MSCLFDSMPVIMNIACFQNELVYCSNHENIWVSFCFLDIETLNSLKNSFPQRTKQKQNNTLVKNAIFFSSVNFLLKV